MLKSIQESINNYIENQQLSETLTKEIIFKEICKHIKKTKLNQIKQITIKIKTIHIKTSSSELKQEILLEKQNILNNLKKKNIKMVDIK